MNERIRHVNFVFFNTMYIIVTIIAFSMLSGISRIRAEQSDEYFKNFYRVEVQRDENDTVVRNFRWSAQDGVVYLIRQPNDNGFNVLSFMATTVVNNQSVAIEINQERMVEFDVEPQLFRKYQSLVHLQWYPLNIGNVDTISLKNSGIVSVAGRDIAMAISDVVVTPITGTKYPDGIVIVLLILMLMMGTWVYFQFSSNVLITVYSVFAVVLIGIWQAVVIGIWQAVVIGIWQAVVIGIWQAVVIGIWQAVVIGIWQAIELVGLARVQVFVVLLLIALVVYYLYYSFGTIQRFASNVVNKIAQSKVVKLYIAPKYARIRWLWEVRYVVQKNWILSKMPWMIGIFSLAYISWQLIGIRFTNIDDIGAQRYLILLSGWDLFDFISYYALGEARVQIYTAWPMYFWASSFQGSWYFDVIVVLSYACLFVSMIYFLSVFIGRKNAIILVSFTSIVFPLHNYDTFPQSYPLLGNYMFIFTLLSAGMLASHFRNPRNVKFMGSVLLFTLSLWGSEIFYILSPFILLLVFYFVEWKKDVKGLISLVWPYAFGWLASVGIYIIFSVIARDTSGVMDGVNTMDRRVAFTYDISAWLKTFLVMQEKAFLPVGLINGITLNENVVPGIPLILDYQVMWHVFGGWYFAVIVFSVFFILFYLMLRLQRLSQKSTFVASAIMLTIAVFPVLILSLSSYYQYVVLGGWVQGHLTTFYSHLGMSGLVFLGCVYVVNKTKEERRLLSVVLVSVLLACYGVITFAYNAVNRTILMANSQKWDANNLVVSYTRTDRPDLVDSIFYAPSFWDSNGVASMPKNMTIPIKYRNLNYWTFYSEYVLKDKRDFSDPANELGANGVWVGYFPNPDGSPVVIFEEIKDNKYFNKILLSSRPVAGILFDKTNGLRLEEIAHDDWTCDRYCVIPLEKKILVLGSSVGFQPNTFNSTNILSQFFIERSSSYSVLFATVDYMRSLRIGGWGPGATVVGVVPNQHSDGGARIWIALKDGYLASDMRFMVDGRVVPALIRVNRMSVVLTLKPEMFSVAGKKRLTISNPPNGQTILVGELIVHDHSTSKTP
jgi:hypothetical protein